MAEMAMTHVTATLRPTCWSLQLKTGCEGSSLFSAPLTVMSPPTYSLSLSPCQHQLFSL